MALRYFFVTNELLTQTNAYCLIGDEIDGFLQLLNGFVGVDAFANISGLVSHYHVDADFVGSVYLGAEGVAAVMGLVIHAEGFKLFNPSFSESIRVLVGEEVLRIAHIFLNNRV